MCLCVCVCVRVIDERGGMVSHPAPVLKRSCCYYTATSCEVVYIQRMEHQLTDVSESAVASR
jgi:hypothetical protein